MTTNEKYRPFDAAAISKISTKSRPSSRSRSKTPPTTPALSPRAQHHRPLPEHERARPPRRHESPPQGALRRRNPAWSTSSRSPTPSTCASSSTRWRHDQRDRPLQRKARARAGPTAPACVRRGHVRPQRGPRDRRSSVRAGQRACPSLLRHLRVGPHGPLTCGSSQPLPGIPPDFTGFPRWGLASFRPPAGLRDATALLASSTPPASMTSHSYSTPQRRPARCDRRRLVESRPSPGVSPRDCASDA